MLVRPLLGVVNRGIFTCGERNVRILSSLALENQGIDMADVDEVELDRLVQRLLKASTVEQDVVSRMVSFVSASQPTVGL